MAENESVKIVIDAGMKDEIQLSTNCRQLKMVAQDGFSRKRLKKIEILNYKL